MQFGQILSRSGLSNRCRLEEFQTERGVHRYDGLISEKYPSGETGQSEMLMGMKFGTSLLPTKENSDALFS